MNIWEKLAKKDDPLAGIADAVEAYIRKRPHAESLDILFALQTAGPERRKSGQRILDALQSLESQHRIVKLGNGYVACHLSTEKVPVAI